MIKEEIYKDVDAKEIKKSILQKELNTKEILIVLGICVVIGLYGYLCIYPGFKIYKEAASNLKQINADITEYEGRMNEMPTLQEKLDKLQRDIKIKSKILSHNMEDGMFMIGLSKVVKDIGVDLVNYSVDEVVPYETFYAIPTSITVRGDYRHIREVMYYLEEQKNITQILDYNMATHMSEESESNATTNEVSTTIVPDSTVYWTNAGNAYHKDSCEVLHEEIKLSEDESALSGSSSVSNKTAACQVCKPYTVNETIVEQTQSQSTKADGTIEATFKFIMYSSQNPTLELENDDATKWKPGKYNPFKSTM